jgi:hypothetical protein
MGERLRAGLPAALLVLGILGDAPAAEPARSQPAWLTDTRLESDDRVRGITLGPIESSLHPGRGYGSEPCERSMLEARRMGATWVSLTPFGRVWDLSPEGVDVRFEAPFEENRAAVARAVRQAHAAGLRVMLVPHLWVETGGWRALLDPGSDEAWAEWTRAYAAFVLSWARLAEVEHVDLFSVGVELRNWVTTTRAPLFAEVIRSVRSSYSGPITYAANWDDVEDTVILGDLDVIGINAFYPLARSDGASIDLLRHGGHKVAADLAALARRWKKPVLLAEIGYTTRPDPAIRPWEWPDGMTNVVVDEAAQARAYLALLEPLLETPEVVGFFVWRLYADPDDMSQEAEWGFSPRGKLAELILRDAFAARWSGEPLVGLPRNAATSIGRY